MNKYIVFLRGINVGGKNKIKMAHLREILEDSDFTQVKTYIQSGNFVLSSDLSEQNIKDTIEELLIKNIDLDSKKIKVLVITRENYKKIIAEAPEKFGQINSGVDYRYDVLFPIDVFIGEITEQLLLREGIDQAWTTENVIYHRRPGPNHPDYTKSGLSRLASKKIYQAITIRNWKTTLKMDELLDSI